MGTLEESWATGPLGGLPPTDWSEIKVGVDARPIGLSGLGLVG